MAHKILVTGGAGYLGSILVPTLLRQGHQVTVLDTFPSGNDISLQECCVHDGFKPIKGDCRDTRLLDALVPKHDVVIPLAALVGAPLCKQDEIGAVTINRDAVIAIVDRLSKDQKLVYPVTNSGYGIGDTGECTEESPLNPISLYGTTKVEAEKAVLDSGNGVTLRLATVFGMAPRMRLDLLVNDFTYRAVKDRALVIFEGHFRRNFIHVRDITKAFIHALDNYGTMNNNAFNVGLSDANLSKMQLCERIKKYVPDFTWLEAPIGEDPDKRDYIVSNAKIEATGYKPDHSLDMGIQELVKGYTMIRNGKYSNV